MSDQPNGRWWLALPPAETQVPCGPGTHTVRWAAGRLCLPSHPDTEGERVLAALGGDTPSCVELAEAWARHADDLGVLAVGPRSAADEIAVTWDDVQAFRAGQGRGWVTVQAPRGPARLSLPGVGAVSGRSAFPPGTAGGRGARSGPMAAHHRGPVAAGPPQAALTRRQAMVEEMERFRVRRIEMLSLLALGPAFQMRLTGSVAAAWSDGGARAGDRMAHRPALEAALTGRLAPAAADWLGVDPDQVEASLHEGPGWGSVELTGRGAARHLRAQLPAGWLASVWACGLAVAGRHLVVAVDRATWPEATVRALPRPGAEPVTLSVRASLAGTGPDADGPHWEIAEE